MEADIVDNLLIQHFAVSLGSPVRTSHAAISLMTIVPNGAY